MLIKMEILWLFEGRGRAFWFLRPLLRSDLHFYFMVVLFKIKILTFRSRCFSSISVTHFYARERLFTDRVSTLFKNQKKIKISLSLLTFDHTRTFLSFANPFKKIKINQPLPLQTLPTHLHSFTLYQTL